MSEAILQLCGLTKRFGSRPILDRVSLDLEAGSIYSIVGPNGCGKTTLLNLVCGLLKQDDGTIQLRGRTISDLTEVRRAQAGLGRVFQSVRIFPRLSVLENLLVAYPRHPGELLLRGLVCYRAVRRAEQSGRSQALKYLEQVGLVDRAAFWADQLSFGEKKLVALGRVLISDRCVLLLDELFAGVSAANQETLKGLLRTQAHYGKLIVLVEHDESLVAELSTWRIQLANGKARLSRQCKDSIRQGLGEPSD